MLFLFQGGIANANFSLLVLLLNCQRKVGLLLIRLVGIRVEEMSICLLKDVAM